MGQGYSRAIQANVLHPSIYLGVVDIEKGALGSSLTTAANLL